MAKTALVPEYWKHGEEPTQPTTPDAADEIIDGEFLTIEHQAEPTEPPKRRGRPKAPGRTEKRDDGWWIVDLPEGYDDAGPYGTKAEDEDDLRGLRRTIQEEGD